MCSDVKKSSIISGIKGIFDIISKRSHIKRSTDDISSSNNHDVSIYSKLVSHAIYV